MRFLHTMLRVRNLDAALNFYVNLLGLEEVRRRVDEKNKYTLVFLAAPEDAAGAKAALDAGRRDSPMVELTFNWDTEDYGEARHFGHLAYEVDDIYAACEKLQRAASPSTGRRATATWRSCARPTSIRSNSCKRASRSRPGSHGPRCRIPESGEAA